MKKRIRIGDSDRMEHSQSKQILADNFNDLHRLDEMAKLSRDYDQLPKNAEIWVYGEKDLQGTKTPHFHLLINHGEIELEIKIEDILKMSIWRTKNNYPKSWGGLANVRDAVKQWLLKPYKKIPGIYNWKRVVEAWNDANSNNEVEDDFAMPNLSVKENINESIEELD